MVLARYRGEGSGPVVIEGTRNGRRERFSISAAFARQLSDNDYLPPLWAARRIGELTRQIRLEGGSPELVNQVKELGLRYGILTEYTAYLVQEPGVVASGPMPMVPPAGALQSREMTGATAFAAAKSSANLTRSASLAAADRAVALRLDELRAGGRDAGARTLRRAGGRLFAWRDGVWTDLAARDSLRAKTIAPFSAAWFALIEARRELKAALAVGTPIILAGRRQNLKVAPGGATEWTPGELERFLQDFEGR